MTSDIVYLVDANVLIEAKNRYYSFSICPGFWDTLVWHAGSGSVRSVDVVKTELAGGNDDLAEWVKHTAPGNAFCSTNDANAVAWYGRIMKWVLAEPRFTPAAKDEFAKSADPWLVAYAGALGMTLVTQETPAPMSRNNVKIPDVCRQFGVPWQNTFEMLWRRWAWPSPGARRRRDLGRRGSFDAMTCQPPSTSTAWWLSSH